MTEMWAAAEQILEGEADPPAVGEALMPSISNSSTSWAFS